MDNSKHSAGVGSRSRGRRLSILKLAVDRENPEEELEFELDFLGSLSTAQRFELMLRKSREMADLLKAHGYGKAVPMLKRS